MRVCKKCNIEFTPVKGLINYCSLKCRNGRSWSDGDKMKKSKAAKKSAKVLLANKVTNRNRRPMIERVTTNCLGCNEPIVHTITVSRKYHAKCWLKNSGGYRPGSTKKNRSVYNGYVMDSGAERAFAIRCDELNIEWRKNKSIYFEYNDTTEKLRRYYPDFYLPQFDTWVEVKGKYYKEIDKNFDAKLKCVNNILLIYSTEIQSFTGVQKN
jgi:hypothetical protein